MREQKITLIGAISYALMIGGTLLTLYSFIIR